jgi:hypothetical protein
MSIVRILAISVEAGLGEGEVWNYRVALDSSA